MTYLLLSDNCRRGNYTDNKPPISSRHGTRAHAGNRNVSGEYLDNLSSLRSEDNRAHIPSILLLLFDGDWTSVTEPLPMACLYNIPNRYHKEVDFKNSRPIFRRPRPRSQPLRYCKKSKHETAENFRSLKVALRMNEKPVVCGMKYLYVGYASLEIGG
jgi:hypothetical protein